MQTPANVLTKVLTGADRLIPYLFPRKLPSPCQVCQVVRNRHFNRKSVLKSANILTNIRAAAGRLSPTCQDFAGRSSVLAWRFFHWNGVSWQSGRSDKGLATFWKTVAVLTSRHLSGRCQHVPPRKLPRPCQICQIVGNHCASADQPVSACQDVCQNVCWHLRGDFLLKLGFLTIWQLW